MSEMWRPLSLETYKGWVEQILEQAQDNLSEWETTFVYDMQRKLGRGGVLTQAQAEKLESIYAEKTS